MRMNFQIPAITKNMFFVPDINKQGCWIIFIKPKHPGATTGIQYNYPFDSVLISC